MKKTIAVLLILLASLPIASGVCEGAVIPSVGSTTGTIGTTVSVPIDIAGVTDLFAWQFDIRFDPSILAATSIGEGSFLLGAGSTFFVPGLIDNVAGLITFSSNSLLGMGGGRTGDGLLATLSFQAIGAGTTSIALQNLTLLDSQFNEILYISRDGAVVIGAATGVPEPDTLSLTLLAALGVGLAQWTRRQA